MLNIVANRNTLQYGVKTLIVDSKEELGTGFVPGSRAYVANESTWYIYTNSDIWQPEFKGDTPGPEEDVIYDGGEP